LLELKGSLEARLAQLVESGADRHDPARFCYIKSMARRCIVQRASVAQLIEKKALKALDDYCLCYTNTRQAAAENIDRISSQNPDSADRMRALFDKGDFKGVLKMAQRRHRGRGQRALAALTHEIVHGGPQADENETPFSFDELLRGQEEEVVQALGHFNNGQGAPQNGPNSELRSFHIFRKTLAKLYASELATHAIEDRPDNPGPLNGQMLATRCLSAMRKLSPSYLNRFVTYIDTLLWLQQTERESETKRSSG
jgi:hypothetical protein